MTFGRNILGVKDLERNLRALTDLVPGGQVADALYDGAWVIALKARDNARAAGLFDQGTLVSAIAPKKVNQYTVNVVVAVPYGAAHEYGLEKQPITTRQRAFFWAMWATERDPMWRALALSADYTIPARPYLRPAVDTEKRAALVTTAARLANDMRRVVSV